MEYIESTIGRLAKYTEHLEKWTRDILKDSLETEEYCKIYARMSPEQKSLLIQSYKNEKLTVLMCGDGANDCSALRNADIGVSLSPEEASIAAPFTSNISNISCLEKLLREGKSSLITSIQTFKYMMVYSLIQFIAITLLMIYNS